VVHADAPAYIALADATVDWQHGGPLMLVRKGSYRLRLLSVSKEGFQPVSVKSVFKAQLSDVVF
jgi:hypothetical protein